jgi:dihydrofolate reductase
MIILIAAIARNGVIGQNNALPWHLPEDMAHFKALTTGQTVLMGRKTWESLPSKFRPLPQRRNIVVTRDPAYRAAGADVVSSIEAGIELGTGGTALYVIGGAELYAHALPRAQRLELTEIAADFPGDAYFPDFDRGLWREIRREPGISAAGWPYAFVTYERP